MPPQSSQPPQSPDTSPGQRTTRRAASVILVVAGVLVLLVLFGLLRTPATSPPVDAVQPLWTEASDLQAEKSYSAAAEVYEQLAALSPQDPEPLLAMGDIYLTQHRWPMAEDAFNRALAREGGNAQALAGLAQALWEQRERLRAVMLWEAALQDRHEPEASDTGVRLALAYLDLGRPADAAATLQQELDRSDNPTARLYLAMLQAKDDPDGARQELVAIQDDAPQPLLDARDYMLAALDEAQTGGSPAEAAKALGLAFVQIEEWQLAREALERALKLDPIDAEAMAFLGHTHAQLGSPALKYLMSAVEAQPDWPLGHYLLGLFYLKHELYGLAVEEFKTTLQLDPGNAQAQVDLAHAQVGLGQYLAAEEALVGAVESAPDDLSFHLALVRFYADHTFRVTDRGLSAAQAAADLAPDDPRVRDLLGWVLFLAGDPGQSRHHLESALRLDPELASAYYHLGVLHDVLGEDEAAEVAFGRAIDLDTDGFYRDQAQKALREMTQARE